MAIASRVYGCLAAVASLALVGCSASEPAYFQLNLQGRNPSDFVVTGKEKDEQATKDKIANGESLDKIATVLDAFYGGPDDPYVIPETGLNARLVRMASGPASGDRTGKQRGLYRQHCAHCHGINGDGAGPTAAFLNPYPRDYRQGWFKFKSTDRAAKPTDEDLRRILEDGIAGTAMPSFLLLPPDEIDALVEYVKYLSMRGQTEQLLDIQLLDDEEPIDMEREALVAAFVTPVAEQWKQAESAVITPPERPAIDTPEKLAASLEKGAELFKGAKAQCAKCHGPTALGDGSEELLFDDWNKVKKLDQLAAQIVEAKKIEDKSERKTQLAQLYESLAVEQRSWLLPKQEIQPRNLRLGIYRFGRRPVDLYRRIYAGVNGTPMPQGGASPSNPSGLTPEEIWSIVDYVRSLPYDRMSDPSVGRGRLAAGAAWHP